MKVLFNHVGYAPEDHKLVLVEADPATVWQRVELVDADGDAVVEPSIGPVFVGAVAGWSLGPWWGIDLSHVRRPGRYRIGWETAIAAGQSDVITIHATPPDRALASEIVFYMKGQRCTGVYDDADRAAPGSATTRSTTCTAAGTTPRVTPAST